MECDCLNGAVCEPFSGECECAKGFAGPRCAEVCPEGRFGANCSEECRCENGGKCHHVSGECTCAPGFTGPL